MSLRGAVLGVVYRWRGQVERDARRRRGRRSAVRVTIRPLDRIWFVRAGLPLALIATVNISRTGIGLVREEASQWPDPGDSMAGTVVVRDEACPVMLRVVHVTGAVVGCEFVSPCDALTASLEQHLQADLADVEMVSGSATDLPETPGVPHWFRGKHGSELHLVERDGHVLRFSLAFHGNYLEGGHGRPVRFGIIAGDTRMAQHGDGSVRWLEMIDAEQFALALRALSWIPGLEISQRNGILRYIS